MNKKIKNRIEQEYECLVETNKTIREIGGIFKNSKSNVHKDLIERLPLLSLSKYEKAKQILNEHLQTRHLKGGESTRKKYKLLKK